MRALWLKISTWTKQNRVITWVIGAIGFLFLASAIYSLRKRLFTKQDELAKLRTQAEQAKLNAMSQSFKADLETNEEKKQELKKQALIQNALATRELEAAAEAEKKNAEALRKLDAIKSWDELDALNKLGR